jgi:uncharacterized membrane protein YfcA
MRSWPDGSPAILGFVSAVLVAFLVAIGAGGFGSLVGIGGGIVIVPLLTVALGHDVKTAIAASLIGVIATSLSASPRYLRSGLVDQHLGLVLLVAAALGGLAGGITAGYLDGRLLALLFGLLLVLVALQMLRDILRPSQPPAVDEADQASGFTSSYVEPTSGEVIAYRARRVVPGTLLSFLAGNVSGLLGVGGGVINVPVMNLIMHVPIRVATTTSTYMLAATAVASSVVYLDAGRIDPLLAAPVALGIIIGARLGARLAMRVPQDALRLAFVAVAFVLAVSMIRQGLAS